MRQQYRKNVGLEDTCQPDIFSLDPSSYDGGAAERGLVGGFGNFSRSYNCPLRKTPPDSVTVR
jgi:hypothetical protein